MKEKKHNLDIYREFAAFQLKAYIYIEFVIEVYGVDIHIRIELANELDEGWKKREENIYKKILVLMQFLPNSYFQLFSLYYSIYEILKKEIK